MEKSRAIELLKLAVPIKALTQQEYADFVEAVNMGMDALEQPEERTEKRTETHSCDLISRQAAIDIERNATVDTNPSHFEAHQKFTQFMDDAEISSFGRWQWSNGFNTALTAVGIDLKKLPPAQPEVLACGNGELVAKSEPTDIDVREAVYNLAEKIGIHQLYALTVELRGEPIQPEPKEGHWIWVAGDLECSKCHTRYPDLYPDYDNAVACPHCGCKMEVEHDSDLHAE